MPASSYRSRTGISQDDYDALLASQMGGCAICGRPPKTRRLDGDHDHRTGQVRGLLCHRCNRTLQSWVSPDWLAAASAYLALSQRAGVGPTPAHSLAENGRALRRVPKRRADRRTAAMREAREGGATLAAIALEHGISRQRVHQLLQEKG